MLKRLISYFRAVRSFLAVGASLPEALTFPLRTPAIAGGAGINGLAVDFKNNLVFDVAGDSIRPQTATATVTGNAIDLQNADGNCAAALQVGAVSGTTPTLTVKVTECATSGGTYADISGATFTVVSAANKSEIINFKRTLRFIKLVGTIAGTSPSFALAAQVYGVRKNV